MAEKTRVVVTGIGVVAPNGTGIKAFDQAIRSGTSGIRQWDDLTEKKLRCQIGGKPEISEEYKSKLLPKLMASKLENNAVIYGCLAGVEAWENAGLSFNDVAPDPESGIVFGSGALGLDVSVSDKLHLIEEGLSRKLGSKTVPESMSSGTGAFLNSILGLGNRILSNSSACTTGSEAVMLGYEQIISGRAKRMLCGSSEGDGFYIWSAFDALRVLCADSNENPEKGSRPMSATSAGFVPSSGAGALVLERLEDALDRGANILAEIKGGFINSGGQRQGGTMTAPNYHAVVQCIRQAIIASEINPEDIDLISGHLTSTKNDASEVMSWKESLGLSEKDFPAINAPKSMIGHAIAGAGSIELVACVLQLVGNYIHPSINCEEVHPEITKVIPKSKIPFTALDQELNTIIKANFGFGDLNCCMVIQKWNG